MKKLAVLIVCAAVMASCDSFSGGSKNQLKAENDSWTLDGEGKILQGQCLLISNT